MAGPLPDIQCRMEDGFARWLMDSGGTVAVTTYQAGKVAFASWDGQKLAMLLRQFDKPNQ